MKIIFLDIDGVLNHPEVYTKKSGAYPLCYKCVGRLMNILNRTDAKIVISSTWRLGCDLPSSPVMKLKDSGALEYLHEDWRTIDWYTEFGDVFSNRGMEIGHWLSNHKDVEKYVILDDDSDMLMEQLPYLIKTTFESGLQDRHVEMAVSILGEISGEPHGN